MDAITDNLKLREVLVKKPFRRILPLGYMLGGLSTYGDDKDAPRDVGLYQILSQTDFLREFEPSGHKINNPFVYPDRERVNPETKEKYVEQMVRCSFAFQRIITIKQLTHLCGNDVQFEMPESKEDKTMNETFFKFKEGWAVKDMEIAWYESAKSVKVTGDTAYVGYMKDGKFGWRVLSYLNGDTLYPHFDSITGELTLFAREYSDLDSEGRQLTSYVEVWDNAYLYRYKQDKKGIPGIMNTIKKVFGLSGYTLISKESHNFPFIPVAYRRDDNGACWSFSQDSIDQYELAFSQLSQNNMAYAFPIMYMKGDDVELIGDMFGSVKALTMGADDDAGFLQKQDASGSFNVQLEALYRMIYEQSFTVIPPEVKSGDLPGVAVKLLYSPAMEFAIKDAQEYNSFIDGMVRIYTHGYGTECGEITRFNRLNIYAWILPYTPQNDAETVTNLATAVQNGFLSKQTASEKIPMYSKNSEWNRIMLELKEQQQADLLNEVLKQKEAAKIKTTQQTAS